MGTAADDALIAGLAVGDPDALAAFVDRHQRRVHGLAYTILHDQRAAEDVAQETFIRVWRNAASFDARRGRASTWVLTITRNLAIDALRLRRAIVLDPDALLAVAPAETHRGPAEEAVVSEVRHRVRAAVDRLPRDQRRALLLAAFGGCTAHEISEREGIPLGTAKTRIRTAMHRLRDALADSGVVE